MRYSQAAKAYSALISAGLSEGVRAVVQDRLAALDPLWPLQVKVRLRQKKADR